MEHEHDHRRDEFVQFRGVDADHARRRANEHFGDGYRCVSVARRVGQR